MPQSPSPTSPVLICDIIILLSSSTLSYLHCCSSQRVPSVCVHFQYLFHAAKNNNNMYFMLHDSAEVFQPYCHPGKRGSSCCFLTEQIRGFHSQTNKHILKMKCVNKHETCLWGSPLCSPDETPSFLLLFLLLSASVQSQTVKLKRGLSHRRAASKSD